MSSLSFFNIVKTTGRVVGLWLIITIGGMYVSNFGNGQKNMLTIKTEELSDVSPMKQRKMDSRNTDSPLRLCTPCKCLVFLDA